MKMGSSVGFSLTEGEIHNYVSEVIAEIRLEYNRSGKTLIHTMDLANKPLDELFEYVSGAKYRLDRSSRDSLEGSHIK
jgi:hypothetical protein